ncbi:MAG: protein kinase, partial [Kiritimatiellae bacterium]|nr:protein kinase [Kiritimatiellia bacterium]
MYECMDKVGGIQVAVKALPPELSHNSVEMEEVRDNFELVYKLNHPNIASVKTLERDGKGEYFLVMDVAEGESLRRWMRRKLRGGASGERSAGGGLPLAEVLPILRQVAAALDYAHAKKVVHRDVKPGNVMIDASGEVKVLDFGLAAQIRTSLSRACQAYRGTSGTGPYMAPEQWMGKPQDGLADQYALGAMAYEMLAGRLPFENSELAVLREAVLRGEADSIPGLPRGAMAALRRAMAKRKAERFASCGEFVAALAAGSGRWSGSGKTFVGWVAALALALGGAWWAMKQTDRPEGSPQQEAEAEDFADETPLPPEEPLQYPLQYVEAPESADEPPAPPEAAAQGEAEEAEDTPPEPTPEEREAAWRAEQSAIWAGARRLDNLQWTAGQLATQLEEFEREPLGFTAHLEKARKAAGIIAGAKAPESAAAVSNTLGRILQANSILTEEVGWLNQNRASRDGAAAAERELAETLDAGLAEYQADRAASAKCSRGRAARKTANDALVSGDFQKALEQFAEAKTLLSGALADARAFRAKSLVEDARSFRDAKRWEKCLDAAQKALVAMPGHEEAAALAKEADLNLVPSIQLTATLNGRPVKAEVTCNGQSWGTTPLSMNLYAGGDYELSLTCAAGLRRYEAHTTVKAKAKGVTPASVALRERLPEPGEERILMLPGNVPMAMVWCPAGTFTMGSPSWEAGRSGNETQHPVRLTEGFWMAKHEVTQKQWESVMGNNPSRWKREDLPVEQVSWDECEAFCRKCREAGVDLRLPTEAEWEHA